MNKFSLAYRSKNLKTHKKLTVNSVSLKFNRLITFLPNINPKSNLWPIHCRVSHKIISNVGHLQINYKAL